VNDLNRIIGIFIWLCFLASIGFSVAQTTADEPATELYIRTAPDGAKVFLDGKEKGVTPGLFKVEPGTAKIVLKLEGCSPIEKEVEIQASRITRLELTFQKMLPDNAPGKLNIPIADGPFQPAWKSLGDGFKCPDWFREAKIGIWLHWGPQAMGMSGDWYAKFMYMQESANQPGRGEFIYMREGGWNDKGAYSNHLERFGHPTKFGYKDVLNLWKAERWNPDKLMAIYKKAGARYVLAMGAHQDNFDLWDSKHQPWNAVNVGPKRDILGDWQKAAKKEDMRFGVSFHNDVSWWWWQPAFMSDLNGNLKGEPYDAARKLDGKGTWWVGLDLKDLYGLDLAAEVTPGADRRKDFYHGVPEEISDKTFARWYCTKWFNRVKDVIDNYRPDFIYFDGTSYPFSGIKSGRGYKSDALVRIAAHFYNSNLKQNNGKLDGLVFAQGAEDPRAVAQAVESALPKGIKKDQPWMYQNTIGEWFYKPGAFYDSGMVIHALLEAVSRDGNFTINVSLTPEGELDPGGLKTLEDMGAWLAVNGDGIYGSHAWALWGEGTKAMPDGNLQEKQAIYYTPQDIRFTVGKDGALYVFVMAWPEDGKLIVKSLAAGSPNYTDEIGNIQLLGSDAKLKWLRDENGTTIFLPEKKPCEYAFALKIVSLAGAHP
jgi:alpha-L-fucosidase